MSTETRRPLVPVLIFIALIVAEKLTVLYLPPDWLRRPLHILSGAPVAFGLSVLFFGWRRIAGSPFRSRLSGGSAAVHGALLALLLGIQLWYRHRASTAALSSHEFRVIATVWTVLIPVLVFSLATIFIPVRSLWHLARSIGVAWLYAVCVAGAVLLFRQMEDNQWSRPSSGVLRFIQEACFVQTRALLHLFYPIVISDPQTHVLGTARFQVEVAWLCSGIEGLLLVGILIALWIVFFRDELNVRRALLIGPIALLLTWVANLIRLALLIVIGDHGHAAMADVGFHAQAGWVSLNLVALGCLFFVQRHPWFSKNGATMDGGAGANSTNYSVVYLLPFTLIVATSLLTQALASGFEALYSLRLVVGLTVLWLLRAQYRQMRWTFGAGTVLAGIAVGVVWTLIALKVEHHSALTIAAASALGTMPRALRWGWIGTRVLAATVTVPLAEELAFRGFMARRVMRPDFEHQPYGQMNWLSLVVSSVAFGAMHGQMWAMGMLAGAIFWWLARVRNSLGAAVAAHAAANACIAVAALALHDYTIW